jgi:hypothetical protein
MGSHHVVDFDRFRPKSIMAPVRLRPKASHAKGANDYSQNG